MRNIFLRGMLSDNADSSATHSHKHVIRSNTGYAVHQGRREIGELYSGIRSCRDLFVRLYSMGIKQGEILFFKIF